MWGVNGEKKRKAKISVTGPLDRRGCIWPNMDNSEKVKFGGGLPEIKKHQQSGGLGKRQGGLETTRKISGKGKAPPKRRWGEWGSQKRVLRENFNLKREKLRRGGEGDRPWWGREDGHKNGIGENKGVRNWEPGKKGTPGRL